ncbi:MAG: hypothetical protein LKI59_01845 [Bacteroidales bacterium]|nr:hypothetical protein [Bacteroidales bacterium]
MMKIKRILHYISRAALIVAVFSAIPFQSHAQVHADKIKAKVDSLHHSMAVPDSTVIKSGSGLNDSLIKNPPVPPIDTNIIQPQKISAARLLTDADSMRLDYDFKDAVETYRKALSVSTDSLEKLNIEAHMVLGQNGLSMMDYCSHPVVVARQKFSLKDFYLYYPLADKSWHPLPNRLDSCNSDRPVNALFFPDSSKTVYFSAKDENGIRNIYKIERKDSLWSAPELIDEQITSSSDEIYPMLSSDGKSLYFSSSGLYGMGGYDLYVTRWDKETKDWSVPVNMGFPYSSPYNDYLFMNTDDGRYSIFASDRDCPEDSVWLYVLEYDSMPVRKSIKNTPELRSLAEMIPAEDPRRMDNGSVSIVNAADNEDTKVYEEKMGVVRALRDSIYSFGNYLDEKRSKLASSSGSAKDSLMNEILLSESALTAKQSRLEQAVRELQQIEMKFLSDGVVIDPSKVSAEADKEIVGASSGYTFVRKTMGGRLDLKIRKPKQEIDSSFRILPVGRFAKSNVLPSGLIYQIQLFTISSRATVKQIKGLSPVFEKLNPSLKYTYYVGLFKSYNDVLSNLNKVKRLGFRSAFIVAFLDGKPIPVSRARASESKAKNDVMLKIYPDDGQNLPDLAVAAIHQLTDRDIIKTVENGSVVYEVGPFEDEDEVRPVVTSLKATGVNNVSVVKVEQRDKE